MTPRRNLIDLFSTFAQFADDRFQQWVTDGQLRRSMQRQELQMAIEQALSETFWSIHWYRTWQTQSGKTAEGHLSAYLQETCYWAVQELIRSQTSHAYSLSDSFQMAIAQLPKVLKGYDSTQGASLKTYASLKFRNALRDTLRQQQALNSRTDWGVLRKVSQKCLTEALQTAGLSTETIASYCLAWSCYKACHAPQTAQTHKLTAPDAQAWEAIAALYNQQRHLTQVPATRPDQLDRWLKDCAKRIRAYLDPPTTSLNIFRFDDDSGELQDDLPDSTNQSPLTLLITQEEVQEHKTKAQKINDLLITSLGQLDPQVQQLLELYYRQGLTQQQIAQQLEMKQYTISRRISSTKEALLKAIAQWSQSTLHISLTSPAVEQMSLILEEWLQTQYGKTSRMQIEEEPKHDHG